MRAGKHYCWFWITMENSFVKWTPGGAVHDIVNRGVLDAHWPLTEIMDHSSYMCIEIVGPVFQQTFHLHYKFHGNQLVTCKNYHLQYTLSVLHQKWCNYHNMYASQSTISFWWMGFSNSEFRLVENSAIDNHFGTFVSFIVLYACNTMYYYFPSSNCVHT